LIFLGLAQPRPGEDAAEQHARELADGGPTCSACRIQASGVRIA
jgi:hypothetical protein